MAPRKGIKRGPYKKVSPESRFWPKVKKSRSCWNWIAATSSDTGYGQFGLNGKNISAHRFSWILNFDAIPKGKCVLHRCDNRRCVRPSHLWLGTYLDNNQDKQEKGRLWVPRFKGEQHGMAILNEKQVRFIRSSSLDSRVLAKRFKVCRGAIYAIKARNTWRHIK